MAQLLTATFIDDSWFATGLTPTVTVVEALTGKTIWPFTMSEISAWCYSYNRMDALEQIVYFFKFDAWTDDVINRYQWNNNKIETTIMRTGWSSITYNKVITDKEMEEIAKKVAEKMPEQKKITLDTTKIDEKLVLIEDKIDNIEVEFDYWTILSWQEKNTLKILENMNKNKTDHKPLKEYIKKYFDDLKVSIPTKDDIWKLKKEIELLKLETIWEEEIEEIIMECLMKEDGVKELMIEEDEDFKSITKEEDDRD